jgi:hypothetical protein
VWVKKRNTSGIWPLDMIPGDLVLREDFDGRNILLFMGWVDKRHFHALIFDYQGVRSFWFNPKYTSEKWWVINPVE